MFRSSMVRICSVMTFVVLLAGTVSAGGGTGRAAFRDKASAESSLRRLSKDLTIKWNDESGLVKSLSGSLSSASGAAGERDAEAFLRRYAVLFGIKNLSSELEYVRTDTAPAGRYIHFRQKKNGLDVVGGRITVRVNSKGVISTVMNNLYPVITISTVPSVSRDKAVDSAGKSINREGLRPDVYLIILPWEGRTHLAYRVDFPVSNGSRPDKYRIYIDAQDGNTLGIENRIMTNGPAVGTGTGVDGSPRTFDDYERNGRFILANQPIPTISMAIKTYSASNGTTLPGLIMRDADNAWSDPAGVDAHYHGNVVFDFYVNNFSNFAWINGSGFMDSGGLLSTVHYDENYDNAFWDGAQMVYGDGGEMFHPLSGALDVVAHEITHGVTEAINELVYCREPGALNESWSDVMGMLVSIEEGDDLPWQLAEEIMKIDETPGFEHLYALRRMDDPPFRTDAFGANDYDPLDPLGSWGQPEHTSEQYIAQCWPWTDNGGVHINSGIPNKAAYLIVTSPDVGPEKAKQIYYGAMFYLTENSQFIDGRNAVAQSTVDLYGAGPELAAVASAFDSVGIN